MRIRIALLRITFALGLAVGAHLTAAPKMPKEHVIDVPAIGEGLSIHNLFQSNMVLQRDKPISIWGWAKAGEKVTVSFAGKAKTATAGDDRVWKVTLNALPANSTPQQLTVQGKDKTLTLENILVGDVWILGGQSNMEFPLDRVQNGQLEIVSANYANIRVLTVPAQNGPTVKKGFPRLHEWSDWSSRHFRKGDWDVCSPEIARELSAIGYVFARRIHMASEVPIGVIDASRGGTTVETWTPTSVLEKIDTPEVSTLLTGWEQKIAEWNPQQDLENRIKSHHNWVKNMQKQGRKADRPVPNDLRPGPAMDHNRPGTCYNSMIAPIAGLTVKGAIFHQGFNNALGSGSAGAAMYYQVFGKMITAWRKAFNDPEMPFGIISLCTAGAPQTRDDYLEMMLNDGIYIREAQYRTFLDFYEAGDKNIGFASSFDKRRSWYHPQLKIPVGERISRWALATQYGLKIKWKPPTYTEMKVQDGQIILKMDSTVGAVDQGPIVGFAIAGDDRRFQPAEANWLVTGKDRNNRSQTDRKTIVLTSPHVPKPTHFRYAWGRNPMGNLQTTDHSDLPFATQRSDDWEMERVPENYVGDSMPPKSDLRRIKRIIQRDLRLDDVQRRLKEAKTFVEENQEKYEKERAAAEKEKAKERLKKEAK
jgi:sialate O-acetylesterase